MNTMITGLLLCLLAFLISTVVYPGILFLARKYKIMDNPNSRKLQRMPVPVMGGVVVFIGIMVPVLLSNIQINDAVTWVGFVASIIMLIIGIVDDLRDIPATLRFIIEIIVVYGVILLAGISIDDFHGLWGLSNIPVSISLPLSIIAGVGIINATNLIDGVDGYSSGFCIMSCALFAILFYSVDAITSGRLALICVGAMIPFFLHNVFGWESKMFIGDSGTLMMGMIMVVFIFSILSGNGKCGILESKEVGLVPFTLAVMSIPVFDTLRVMGARIVRGVSPFHPDKTHLHHLFIELGFSHIGTSLTLLLLDLFIVIVWFVTWKLGGSIDVQLYVVVALSLIVTFGFYRFMKVQQNSGPLDDEGFPIGSRIWRAFCLIGEKSHFEANGFWAFVSSLMDGKLFKKQNNN